MTIYLLIFLRTYTFMYLITDYLCIIYKSSHNELAGYDEVVPIAKKKGFDVSFDSMVVETN